MKLDMTVINNNDVPQWVFQSRAEPSNARACTPAKNTISTTSTHTRGRASSVGHISTISSNSTTETSEGNNNATAHSSNGDKIDGNRNSFGGSIINVQRSYSDGYIPKSPPLYNKILTQIHDQPVSPILFSTGMHDEELRGKGISRRHPSVKGGASNNSSHSSSKTIGILSAASITERNSNNNSNSNENIRFGTDLGNLSVSMASSIASSLSAIAGNVAKMDKSIQRLENDFAKMRGGAVRSDMFNHVNVYLPVSNTSNNTGFTTGTRTGVNILELSQVTMVNSLRFDVTVYDPLYVTAVGDAIRDCGFGVNPSKGEKDNIWTIKVNKPSKEAREAIVKIASTRCEKARMEIRTTRKELLDILKTRKGKAGAGDDELKRLTKELEGINDKALDKVTKLLKSKEIELLT